MHFAHVYIVNCIIKLKYDSKKLLSLVYQYTNKTFQNRGFDGSETLLKMDAFWLCMSYVGVTYIVKHLLYI